MELKRYLKFSMSKSRISCKLIMSPSRISWTTRSRVKTEMLQTLDLPVLAMINKINKQELGISNMPPSMSVKKKHQEASYTTLNQ